MIITIVVEAITGTFLRFKAWEISVHRLAPPEISFTALARTSAHAALTRREWRAQRLISLTITVIIKTITAQLISFMPRE